MNDEADARVPGWYAAFKDAVLMQLPRPDEIDQAAAERWSGDQGALRKALVSALLLKRAEKPVGSAEKFALLVDLGVITVPEGYVAALGLWGLDSSDKVRVLQPGDKFRVEVYRPIVSGMTTSRERMAYLERCKGGNVYLGAEGVELVIAQKIGQLQKDHWYMSFGENNLLETSENRCEVPSVFVGLDGSSSCSSRHLDEEWYSDEFFFHFSDVIEPPDA